MSKPTMINFRQVEITDLKGEKMRFDVSKSLGNHIYQTTSDLGMLEVAQSIYKTGNVELSDEARQGLIKVVQDPGFPFLAVVKKWLLEQLE